MPRVPGGNWEKLPNKNRMCFNFTKEKLDNKNVGQLSWQMTISGPLLVLSQAPLETGANRKLKQRRIIPAAVATAAAIRQTECIHFQVDDNNCVTAHHSPDFLHFFVSKCHLLLRRLINVICRLHPQRTWHDTDTCYRPTALHTAHTVTADDWLMNITQMTVINWQTKLSELPASWFSSSIIDSRQKIDLITDLDCLNKTIENQQQRGSYFLNWSTQYYILKAGLKRQTAVDINREETKSTWV